MAKSDSFFIRSSLLVGNLGSFKEDSIDLGAYVDALGKSVLRIHNIAVTFSDKNGNAAQIQQTADSAAMQFQLTTQSQSDTVVAANRSVVATGIVYGVNQFGTDEFPQLYEDMDNLPQLWTNGYLIAVDRLYLGGEASTGWVAADEMTISIVMECTVETMSTAAAMALALSQQ